jgi:hypothetical protein
MTAVGTVVRARLDEGVFDAVVTGLPFQHGGFVLQRVNTEVFREPRLVMENMLLLGEHVGQKLQGSRSPRPASRWEVPRVVRARGSGDPWLEEGGSFWRTITFLEDCQSFDTIANPAHGREVGYGLAMFHNMISDLPASALADTLAGFHITPAYLSHYEHVLETSARPQGQEVEYGMAFVASPAAGVRAIWAGLYEEIRQSEGCQ